MRARTITALSTLLAVYALYWVVGIVETRFYRISFLLVSLVLVMLTQPARARSRAWLDWLLAGVAVLAFGWPLVDVAAFPYRAATPGVIDLVLGTCAVLLVLEATRCTTGWALPITAIAALVYAWIGPILELVGLGAIAHRGYYVERIIAMQYITLDGIFGVPLDVAATYIILFTIFGAVLEYSGAGQFYIEWARALTGRSQHGATPGRTMATAGYLLGSVSGSGVATTVTLGSVGWPMMRRAQYPPDTAGAVLAAAGLGAILAPPSMGAAAFLIAEFLEIRYVDVIRMAVLPAVLYYLSVLLMIEADARRLRIQPLVDAPLPLGRLTRERGFLFLPIIAIVGLLIAGMTAFRAVFWATLLTVALSFLTPATALRPRRLLQALASGARGALGIIATCATAGIIVGVVTLTGLGLKLSGLIVGVAGGSALATVLLAVIAIWLLGLAVPVTASYIIAAVTIAPALTAVGIAPAAAHMFIFYYAVLSDVSPPTALSPFAAAAITGGNAFRTMMITWKYTLPAFLIPLIFTTGASGEAILLTNGIYNGVIAAIAAGIGMAALVAGFSGWITSHAHTFERAACLLAGVLVLLGDGAVFLGGLLLLGVTVVAHRRRNTAALAAG